jgi:hypothetical protein
MTKRTAYIVFSVALALSVILVLSSSDMRLEGQHTGYSPEQPIAFSHRLHASELQIDCRYCHFGAEQGRHAGLPSVGLCMNCHKFVSAPMADVRLEEANAQAAGRPVEAVLSAEIAKIRKAASDDGGDPFAWIKIHNLPEYVYFDHSRHVMAGVDCQQCHGPIETMERVRQVEDLSMGWCVDCHREVNEKGWLGNTNLHASTDCAGCHY